jgi:hypothetical protein
MNNLYSATEQPEPVNNEKPAVWELVQADFLAGSLPPTDPVIQAALTDMKARDEWGRSKYKTPLQPFNGRDALIDFYQEVLDGAAYARQFIYEAEGREMDDEERFLFANVEEIYDGLLFSIYAAREYILNRDGK